MYMHTILVCTCHIHVCTVLPNHVQVVRIPDVRQHELAGCQLLSRFSPTNHTEVHFREESLEKSLESDCSHFQEALLNLVNPRNLVVRGLLDFLGGWAGAARRVA